MHAKTSALTSFFGEPLIESLMRMLSVHPQKAKLHLRQIDTTQGHDLLNDLADIDSTA